MSPRPIPEWIGKDDGSIPARVILRVRDRNNNCCQAEGCGMSVMFKPSQCDHIVALCNGGANRENNLQTLCIACHKAKSAQDVAEKSHTYHRRLSHAGIKTRKRSSFRTNKDGPFKKKMDGSIVLRNSHAGVHD